MQGPVAVGAKVENRIKLHKKAKLVSTLGRMTCKTRMGRENATAGQAELKLRLGDDQRSQVRSLPLSLQIGTSRWIFILIRSIQCPTSCCPSKCAAEGCARCQVLCQRAWKKST